MGLMAILTAHTSAAYAAASPRIFLDPEEAEREKAKKSYYHHVFRIPCLRAFGLPLIAVAVLLHNLYLTPTPLAWTYFWRILTLYTIYIAVSWLILLAFYSKARKFNLGRFFLLFDIILFLVAIYYSGGEKSWLLFLLMMRTADQTGTTRRNTTLFAIASTAGYVLLMLYLAGFERRALSLPSEITKAWFVFGSNMYLAFVANASDSLRNSMISAVRVSRDLIRQIQNQSSALQASEARYRLLAENSTDVIWTVGLDMRLTYISPSVKRLLGFTGEEAISRTMEQAFTPAAFEKSMKIFAEEMAVESAGRADPNQSRILELELVHKDGSTVPVECNFSFLRDPAGKAISIIAIARDISERKRGEHALRKSEEHYRSLFENMLEGFAHCKMIFEDEQPVDFEYLAVNYAFEHLTGLKNVVGRRVTEVTPGIRDSNSELFQIYGRVALTGRPERFETYVHGLGLWFTISVYSHEKGTFVAIFYDISGRKKAEFDLKVANEALEKRVDERTSELKAKTANLEEVNTALKVLLDRREEDRKELEEAIAGNLKNLVLPYLEKLGRTRLSDDQATYLSILQSHLAEIESRFVKRLSLHHMGLTPTEIQIAVLIRDGKETKEIAEILHISVKAVEFHRNNIRRKLNIKNKKENLRSHLIGLS